MSPPGALATRRGADTYGISSLVVCCVSSAGSPPRDIVEAPSKLGLVPPKLGLVPSKTGLVPFKLGLVPSMYFRPSGLTLSVLVVASVTTRAEPVARTASVQEVGLSPQ